MKTKFGHLTYCTNIHPGESWVDHFRELQTHLPLVKKEISPDKPMGIGLRLSNEASLTLIKENNLLEFQNWLKKESLYVIAINGFPFGGFHSEVVKEDVYKPDWSDKRRIEYTLRLFSILKVLLPANEEGGVSTPPLSYFYFDTNENDRTTRRKNSTKYIIKTLVALIRIHNDTGKTLHLDIEPEPDGLLGDFKDWVTWYTSDLLPNAIPSLMDEFGYNFQLAEELTRKHIRLCLDVCHLAVTYEVNPNLISELRRLRIQVGRIQVSSALKVKFPENVEGVLQSLKPFDEKKYLHQVVVITNKGEKKFYRDLNLAIEKGAEAFEEWRIHYHVPIFLESYETFLSTQEELKMILAEQKRESFSQILEVETYTWNVLPQKLQLPIGKSIVRELQWLRSFLDSNSQI
ncbi:hypothetical protein LEP1GSC202_2579 [Leptospira yanagawae serovar Saopaulo str. Sao Paulo = ATCC 700523]|uniref:Xylose isomerase-like TIM barrel domain protein n=1 Tax=Leptospira yanagawae serovar Saopaulo str. Sao Paulo = ATCC 700523 TaxID=1249483 RepID=A0A5E8HAZ1_9LEPT|nr:metabolite traffic protein EboE [Leptospira yanagawae]EOQ87176.1 hypothetical protein LEP1GSC202_2579 [Leptospira yanagawae serovar Saopaulo str. Sao Paulo = ATCC 700523]